MASMKLAGFALAIMLLGFDPGPPAAAPLTEPVGHLSQPGSSARLFLRVPRVNRAAPATEYRGGMWWSDARGKPQFVAGTRFAANGILTKDRPTGPLRVVDLDGAYMIPPLADAHAHRLEGPWSLPMMNGLLESGVFYYKNPSSFAPVVQRYRHIFNRPDAIDAIWSQGSLTTAGSHPVPLYAQLAEIYRTPAEEMDGKAYFLVPDVETLDRRWPEILAAEPDFIKLLFVNRGGSSMLTGTPPDVAKRAVLLAHRRGLHVTAHVVTAVDLAAALDAGVDEVTHLPGWTDRGIVPGQNDISDALAARMAAARVGLVTTASIAADEDFDTKGWKPDALQQLQARNLRRLARAGVPLYIGTDDIMTPRREVEYLRRLRIMDDAGWLAAWIRTGPDAIFPDRAIGRLQPGYEASFLALACNPLERFECIDQIVHREKQGQQLSLAKD